MPSTAIVTSSSNYDAGAVREQSRAGYVRAAGTILVGHGRRVRVGVSAGAATAGAAEPARLHHHGPQPRL